MSRTRLKKGQARIIEALITLVMIITVQLLLANFYQGLKVEEPSPLRQYAYEISELLRNREIGEMIMRSIIWPNVTSNWEMQLKTLVSTLLPPGIYYNVTVIRGTTGEVLNAQPISNLGDITQEEFSEYLTVKQSYTVSIPIQMSQEVRKPVDVMLVVDKSGSMREEINGVPKIEWLKQALITFLSSDVFNNSTDRIGLISFSDNAWNGTNWNKKWGYPLTNNFDLVKDRVFGLTARGKTYGGLGLLYAIMQLNGTWAPYNPDSVKVIIFLTDGMINIKPMDESRPDDPTGGNLRFCGAYDDGKNPQYARKVWWDGYYDSDGYIIWWYRYASEDASLFLSLIHI